MGSRATIMTGNAAMQVLEEIRERLGGQARHVSLRPGEALFHQGDATRGMFLLRQGRVRLLRHAPDGREVILHAVMPGESFAEASLFSPAYHCSCIASAASSVILLPGDATRALLAADAALASAFMARMAAQVRDLRATLELRNIRSAEERLLAALRLRAQPDGTVPLPDTLKALAAQIGMAHETLYRALARLTTAGLVQREGDALRLHRPDDA